ncbi:MAG TPA: tRNA uridine(34) 5-carboxymethylaminomethyl modification radical SAM/GNAT enzyme Elp3 [archaeon]|nr:tRNA uridine(34) 5-carboxymethylaminomethyl modification radical SAM/GNAT enzyme Elp3 [archaeon]
MQKLETLSRALIEEINKGKIKNSSQLHLRKLALCGELGLEKTPSNTSIAVYAEKKDSAFRMLKRKPVRTISGVSSIAVMTKPIACPHGTCTMCPGGPKSFFGNVPQSYTGKEPSTMRGIRLNYDSYLMTFSRLEQYVATGHNPEKVELIVMGGTFPSFPDEYKNEFIKYSFKAMNDFSENFYEGNSLNRKKFNEFFELPREVSDTEKSKKIQGKLLELKGECFLEKELIKNEKAKIRNVALCIETKPDWCKEKEINDMLSFGTTRVELGIQSIHDHVLKRINRGHSNKDSIEAIQLLKDSFLKVGFHSMIGLPEMSKEMDIEMFKEFFSNPDYMPDALKIYPTMVMPGTALFKEWKQGKYKEISTENCIEIISEAKRFMPKWTRIMRIQRDIPTNLAEAGVNRNNLRQYVEQACKEKGIKCRCIRCRETGISKLKKSIKSINSNESEFILEKEVYDSSKGKEIFLSFEDKKNELLAGFLRLRIPFKGFRKEITDRSAGIRELHVYGEAVPLGEKEIQSEQHKGYGLKLIEEAEKIASENYDAKKLLVISGIGAREYYKTKAGYIKDGPYMSKKLN